MALTSNILYASNIFPNKKNTLLKYCRLMRFTNYFHKGYKNSWTMPETRRNHSWARNRTRFEKRWTSKIKGWGIIAGKRLRGKQTKTGATI